MLPGDHLDGAPVETVIALRLISPFGECVFSLLLAKLTLELARLGASVAIAERSPWTCLKVQHVSPAAAHNATSALVGQHDPFVRMQIVQVQMVARAVQPQGQIGELPSGTHLRTKLTKRLLMILPTGSRIVANCSPGLNEILGPRDTRDAPWRRALEREADGRMFMLFPAGSVEAYVWAEVNRE